MAKISDIREIVDAIQLKVTDEQIEAMSLDLPAIRDVQAVISLLLKEDLVNIYTVKRVINSQPKPVRRCCGHCNPTFGIKILSTDQHRINQAVNPHEYHWLTIPVTYVPCPNCSGSKKAIDIIRNMEPEERTWTWIVLYEQAVTPQLYPADFRPGYYWQGLDLEPSFSPAQIRMIENIYQTAKGRISPLGKTAHLQSHKEESWL